MTPDISVVMPTYRRPHTITPALRSVLDQEGATVEALVIDDCPESSAEPVVRAIGDSRIRYLGHVRSSNGRPAVLRNVVWPQARAEIVHFLDDDDLVPQGHYAAVKDAFARRNVGVVVGKVEPFGENAEDVRREGAKFIDGNRRAAKSQRLGSKRAWASRLLFGRLMWVCGAGLIRKDCVKAVGGFHEEMDIWEDVDFYARVIWRFGAEYLNRVALQYRIGQSVMQRVRDQGMEEKIYRAYREMHTNFRKTHGVLEFYALKLAARTVLEPAWGRQGA